MKKILFFIFAALAFVACEKEGPMNSGPYLSLIPNEVIIDKETGGSVMIQASNESYVRQIEKCVNGEEGGYEAIDIKVFFEKNNYQNPIIYEDIIECKEYEAFGCKIIPQTSNKYTIIVEPNSNCNFFEIHFNRIKESKEYGKIGDMGFGRPFKIYLK